MHLRNGEKRFSTEGENGFSITKFRFQIYVILSSPPFTYFGNFRAAICLAISEQYFRLGLLFLNTQVSCTMLIERQSDVEHWRLQFFSFAFVLIEIFVMAYGHILNLNQINNDLGTN